MVIVSFSLFLTTKPSVVKFEVEGTVTLTGKDQEINKMLEVDPEIKVPHVFEKVYQNAFAAMYLLSTILKVPPPPHNLFPPSQREGLAAENVDVESRVGEPMTEEPVEQRTVESPGVEGGRAVTEERETATEDTNVEPRVGETRTEERVEERNETLTNTER